MVEGTLWFGLASLPQGLDLLPSLRGKWIPKFTKMSYRIMSGWLSASWSLVEVGWCSRTMILCIKVNPPQTGPDLNPIELLNDLKRGVHTRHPINVSELKQFCEEEWSKIPPEHCAGLIHSYQKHSIKVIAAEGGLTRYSLQGFTYFFLQNCECVMGVFNKDARN